MIEVENILGKPKTIPDTKFGHHFDGEKFIFFESYEERISYMDSLNVFSLELWKSEANQLHNALFESYYLPLQYEGESDIALTATWDERYKDEAISLAKWRSETYHLIEDVTEVQARLITPQEFVDQLPKLNI